MNKKGIALILGFVVITVLTVLSAAVVSRSISESKSVQRQVESTQAFWAAEAAVNRTLVELKNNYTTTGTGLWPTTLSQGRYSVDIADVTIGSKACKRVTARGFFPATGQASSERILEAIIEKYIPANFYDNAVYSAGTVDFNGNSFIVRNDIAETNPCSDPTNPPPCNDTVLYAGAFEVQKPENIIGAPSVQDTTISPLAMLDFEQLLAISQSQGNYYDAARLAANDPFPSSFWYSPGVPNVVYVGGDLTLNGNVGTVGGFLVVAGDVITNPAGEYDATINGNGVIQGVVYTRGEFSVNGGGGGLNVDGGVWAGHEVELNGNATITYNKDYMDAIKGLNINPNVQINSWRDTQNPYSLAP
jgi:hypothetical protein